MKQTGYPLLFVLVLLLIVHASCLNTDNLSGFPRGALTLFATMDDNNDNVVSAYEFALFLERFYEDGRPSGTVKNRTDIPTKHRDAFLAVLQQMNKYLFNGTLVDHGANETTSSSIEDRFSITLEQFLTVFQSSRHHRTLGTLGSDEDPNCPYQVHVAHGKDNARQTVIMWVTKNQINDSIVFYGTESTSLQNSSKGIVYTYNVGILGGWHYFIHKVHLTNLQPFTRYYYKVGAPICYSKTFDFRTAPVDPAHFYPQSLLVFGDQGTFMPMGIAVAQVMIEQHLKRAFDLVLHVGDISYAGTGGGWEISSIWDLWFWQVEPIAARVAWMPSVGNHEAFYNFTAYKARFELPGDSSCTGISSCTNFYYSYDFGGMHIISMSTESYVNRYDEHSEQYKWLENDLIKANINRKRVPWIVLLGHRPFYSSNNDTNINQPRMSVESLMFKYKVDFTITGHMHCYERTYPVNNLQPVMTQGISKFVYANPEAPFHLVIGTAGAWIHEKWNPQPAWSVHRELNYGFGRLDVMNATHIHFQMIRQHDQSIADDLWLVKNMV